MNNTSLQEELDLCSDELQEINAGVCNNHYESNDDHMRAIETTLDRMNELQFYINLGMRDWDEVYEYHQSYPQYLCLEES